MAEGPGPHQLQWLQNIQRALRDREGQKEAAKDPWSRRSVLPQLLLRLTFPALSSCARSRSGLVWRLRAVSWERVSPRGRDRCEGGCGPEGR